LAPATGAVFSVLPAENATGNFTKIVQRVPVRILLDGDASALGRLRPGLSVVAKVDLRTSKDANAPSGVDVASASVDAASVRGAPPTATVRGVAAVAVPTAAIAPN